MITELLLQFTVLVVSIIGSAILILLAYVTWKEFQRKSLPRIIQPEVKEQTPLREEKIAEEKPLPPLKVEEASSDKYWRMEPKGQSEE